MIVEHRGHEIRAERGPSMTGDELLFWSIFRISDGYECASGFEGSAETVPDMVALLRERVDGELAEDDPWEERRSKEK